MDSDNQAIAAALARVALAYDGAFFGAAVAFLAIRTLLKYRKFASALVRIRAAPYVRPTGLYDAVCLSAEDKSAHSNQNLVVVRGHVQPKPVSTGRSTASVNSVLVSPETGNKAVVIQRTQTCIYNEWRGLFGWTFELQSFLAKNGKARGATSLQAVPFVLGEGINSTLANYVVVNLDGSTHPLPLTTVYHRLHPVEVPPFMFLQVILGHGYPVGILDEEKILPVGKEISAVGLCGKKDGVLEIKSSKAIPYFLSEMTKDELVADLASRSKVLLWGSIFLGAVSVGVLCYSALRNWFRWIEWRNQRPQIRDQRSAAVENSEDESGDVPDGELCVICLMRRRRSAIIPCGHLVCCPRCALMLEREVTPKCPVCRQVMHTSVRVYSS